MVGSMHQFGNRYCDPIPSPWHAGCDYMGATNMEELHAILKARPAPLHCFRECTLAATILARICQRCRTPLLTLPAVNRDVWLQATVLVRRLKRDVLTQLPPKLRTRIRIDTDPFFNKVSAARTPV